MNDTLAQLQFSNKPFQQQSQNNKTYIPNLTVSQIEDIMNYRNHKFRMYLSNKCTDLCMKNSNYKNCLDNCMEKLILSNLIFEQFIQNNPKSHNMR